MQRSMFRGNERAQFIDKSLCRLFKNGSLSLCNHIVQFLTLHYSKIFEGVGWDAWRELCLLELCCAVRQNGCDWVQPPD